MRVSKTRRRIFRFCAAAVVVALFEGDTIAFQNRSFFPSTFFKGFVRQHQACVFDRAVFIPGLTESFLRDFVEHFVHRSVFFGRGMRRAKTCFYQSYVADFWKMVPHRVHRLKNEGVGTLNSQFQLQKSFYIVLHNTATSTVKQP